MLLLLLVQAKSDLDSLRRQTNQHQMMRQQDQTLSDLSHQDRNNRLMDITQQLEADAQLANQTYLDFVARLNEIQLAHRENEAALERRTREDEARDNFNRLEEEILLQSIRNRQDIQRERQMAQIGRDNARLEHEERRRTFRQYLRGIADNGTNKCNYQLVKLLMIINLHIYSSIGCIVVHRSCWLWIKQNINSIRTGLYQLRNIDSFLKFSVSTSEKNK